MKIELKTLKVNNFQGIKEFELNCTGDITNIRGSNGAGKTTLKNAFTWLLFDKNTEDKKVFGIKPVDSDGKVIHNLETSVEGIFEIDGVERTFKRSLVEKIRTIRGTTETKIDDETSWYVDGVPKKKTEYNKVISSLIDENKFKMITDPLYFNTKIDWKERRAMLMNIVGDINDETIIASNKELEPLKGKLFTGRNIEDVREITKHAIEPVAKRLKEIPIQILEAEKAKPSVEDIEINEIEKMNLQMMIQSKEQELSSIVNGVEITKKEVQIKELQAERNYASKGFDYDSCEEYIESITLQENIDNLQREISNRENENTFDEKHISFNLDSMKKLSDEWDEVFNQSFTGTICPTCKRELPEDEVEAHKKEFNLKKAIRLDEIEEKNKALKEEKKERASNIVRRNNEIKDLEAELKRVVAEKEKVLAAVQNKAIAFNDEQLKKRDAIDEQIKKVQSEIETLKSGSQDIVDRLNEEIAMFNNDLDVINEKVANKTLLDKQNKRIEALKKEESKASIEKAELEKVMYLCDKFIQVKADLLTEKINSHFTLAKFKLFDIQKNDGIKEMCEVMMDGVVYRDLNNAGRINIGLDIINTLCKRFDIQAPIVIDNAESVVELFDTYSQQIRLIVDGNHKKLYVEE